MSQKYERTEDYPSDLFIQPKNEYEATHSKGRFITTPPVESLLDKIQQEFADIEKGQTL